MKINSVFVRNVFLILGTLSYIFLFYQTHGIWGLIADIIILLLTFIIEIKVSNTRLSSRILGVLKKSKFILNIVKMIIICLMILFPIVTFDIILMIAISAYVADYYMKKRECLICWKPKNKQQEMRFLSFLSFCVTPLLIFGVFLW
jgi:hypothetical protein